MKTHLKNRTINKVTYHLTLLENALKLQNGERYYHVFNRAIDDLNKGRYGTMEVEKGVRLARQVIKEAENMEAALKQLQKDAA